MSCIKSELKNSDTSEGPGRTNGRIIGGVCRRFLNDGEGARFQWETLRRDTSRVGAISDAGDGRER